MKTQAASKGPWMHRFAIRLFTIVLAILIFWVLGFLVEDIRSIRGPDYATIEKAHLDQDLVAQREALERQVADLTRQIQNQTDRQRVVGDSSRNLQQTINQLIELQKLGMQKGIAFSETEQANFTSSLNLFLENQKKYQELSQTVSDMLERKQGLVREKEQAEQEIDKQRQPAREAFQGISEKHRLKLAILQLAILLPILAVAAGVIIRKRGSIYFPLFLAFGAATLLDRGGPAPGLLHPYHRLSQDAVARQAIQGSIRALPVSGMRIPDQNRSPSLPVLDPPHGQQEHGSRRTRRAGRDIHLSVLRLPPVRGMPVLRQDQARHAAALLALRNREGHPVRTTPARGKGPLAAGAANRKSTRRGPRAI